MGFRKRKADELEIGQRNIYKTTGGTETSLVNGTFVTIKEIISVSLSTIIPPV